MIPYSKQTIDEDDINAVVNALKSAHLTQGALVGQFEQAITTLTHAKFGIAVNSGTAALHIACLALGVDESALVWTTPLSFVATGNCALYCGASIDFVDVEQATGNMCMETLARKLELAKTNNRLPHVIIPVHLCGSPCDMKKLHALSQNFGFRIIEDACHALGASIDADPIGACVYSDITVFSFHAVKTITTAEGGMALCNDKELAHKLRLLSSHGITKDDNDFINDNAGSWYHEQHCLGFNYRMNELSAALGLSQLKKLPNFERQREKAVDYYKMALRETCQFLGNDINISSNHLLVAIIPSNKRKLLFEFLRKNNVWVQLHYLNIANQPYYQALGFNGNDYPNANQVSDSSISIPVFPYITTKEQDAVIHLIKQGLKV